jgi:hypothetical protein
MKVYDVVAMGKSDRELMILRRSETPRTPVIDDPRIVEGIDYRPQISFQIKSLCVYNGRGSSI